MLSDIYSQANILTVTAHYLDYQMGKVFAQ